MNKTDLLALADRLGTISPSEKSPEGLLADNLCLDISSFILRKLAALEPAERRVCPLSSTELLCREPYTDRLYNLTGILDHE